MCWIPVEEYFFVRNIGLELIDLGKFSDIFLGSMNCSVSVDDFFFFFFDVSQDLANTHFRLWPFGQGLFFCHRVASSDVGVLTAGCALAPLRKL